MNTIHPVKLAGKFIQLEPFENSHRDELRPLTQDETIWQYFSHAASGLDFDPWFNKAIEATKNGRQLAFVVRRLQDQKIIGSSRYYDITLKQRRLMIGYTWYIQAARGTAANPECKLLLLTHAFENLNINRIGFSPNANNVNSIAALKKLGATEEGTLRQYIIMRDGNTNDSVLFSIIKSEWPVIKENLQSRLLQY